MALGAGAGRGRSEVAAALRDAALVALLVFGLAVPLLGFRLEDLGADDVIRLRFEWVALAAAIAFVGRLVLRSSAVPAALAAHLGRELAQIGREIKPHAPWIYLGIIVLAFVFPLTPLGSRYALDVMINILIYVMLGWGLNVVVGLAGLLDLGYVAFYAVGAYSFALLAIHFDLSFWTSLPVAGAMAAFFGILLGFPVLRLRGDYLAIVTLGFGEIVRLVLINWVEVTRGPEGISGIPSPSLFGVSFARLPGPDETAFHELMGIPYSGEYRLIFLYFLILILALATNAFTLKVRRLPLGRAWEALREDEIACRTLGINPTSVKLSAFAIGAMFGGFAGSFFAAKNNFISPESFTFVESALVVAIVVLGGMGSQIGVVLAAVVLIGLGELLREFEEFRMLIFGGAMVMIMMWRPRGLLDRRAPTLRLHGDTARGSG